MAAGATYDPIATQTLASAAASITFSSIPSTYTDLRLVLVLQASTASQTCNITLNNDGASNYSFTALYGTGAAAGSYRSTSAPSWNMHANLLLPTSPNWEFNTYDIFSYANTSVYKTALSTRSDDLNGSGEVDEQANLWRSTAAITTVKATCSGTFSAGTTATLYGIKAA